MNVFSPLSNFNTREKYFAFSDYLSMKSSYEKDFTLENVRFYISGFEVVEIKQCSHWVILNNSKSRLENESVTLNTLLIAFWVQSANKISIKHIFNDKETGCEVISNGFQFNKMDRIKTEFDINDLKKVKEYFHQLESITITNGRLHTALSNTFQGCIAPIWKTAYLLYTAAIEAILTYRKTPGITKRLSQSYACLIETDSQKRQQEYANFCTLYNIRSDIMHGNVMDTDADDNLTNLSKLASALRRLWQFILSESELIDILEKQNKDRKKFFQRLELGFNASVAN